MFLSHFLMIAPRKYYLPLTGENTTTENVTPKFKIAHKNLRRINFTCD